MSEVCYWIFCFVPPDTDITTRIFGFAEFLAAVALLVVVYTIADVRYKFRIAISPGYLYLSTFFLIATVGFLSLLTEVWLAEHWWIPKTAGITRSSWQGILGLLFLGTFLTWVYYAFIRPPIFGRRNARRFGNALYRCILRGNDDELKVIANELARSAKALVKYSGDLAAQRRQAHPAAENDIEGPQKNKKEKKNKPTIYDYGNQVLLVIANRKFCRNIVSSSPVTAQAFFEEMTIARKYHIPIGQFARNVATEAFSNKSSFIYDEDSGHVSGLMGYLKPVSQAMFGNYQLVEALGDNNYSPLDIHHEEQSKWDAKQWEAFRRVTLMTLEDCLENGYTDSPRPVYRAMKELEHAFHDVASLNETTEYREDIYGRLHTVSQFIGDAIVLIDDQEFPPKPASRNQVERHRKNIYDYIAELIFNFMFAASKLTSPADTCWSVHHNIVWTSIFETVGQEGKAWNIVRHKVRRLIYNEIKKLSSFPNFRGSRLLGLCLNVGGIKKPDRHSNHTRDSVALVLAAQSWAKKNYRTLRQVSPDVAVAVLMGNLSYDEPSKCLVKSWPRMLSSEPRKDTLIIDAPQKMKALAVKK